jgi:hypothetical protein
VDRAFLVTRSINAVYSLEADEMKKFPLAIKNSSDLMIVISNDKRIFFLKDEELKKINVLGTTIGFKLKEISSIGANSIDLDKIRAVIEM